MLVLVNLAGIDDLHGPSALALSLQKGASKSEGKTNSSHATQIGSFLCPALELLSVGDDDESLPGYRVVVGVRLLFACIPPAHHWPETNVEAFFAPANDKKTEWQEPKQTPAGE